MDKQTSYKALEPKDRDLDQLASNAIKDPKIVNYLLDGLSIATAKIKYGCLNTLVIISEKQPDLLYPYFELFEQNLTHKDKFFKWGAIIIIANLTKVDQEKKFDKIFNTYYSEILNPVMITASNITKGSAVIAKAKPYLPEEITKELLKIKEAQFQTPECKNIVLGHMISAFDKFFKQVENKEPVINLIEKQLDNPMKPTKNKAERFIKKWKKVI